MKLKGIFLLIVSIFILDAVAIPPLPPVGKRWVRNEQFSDEFNGNCLDLTKWYDYHPNWKGREPGIFLPSQVNVADGYMTIRGGKLEKDTVIGSRTFNIACGAVVSRTTDAWFGYYECKFKAAKTTMSTTFWMSTRSHYEGPADCKDSYGLELDIQECIGREGDFKGKWFAKGMHANSHFWYRDCEKKNNDLRAKEVRFNTDEYCSDAFNTYGGWWKDESTASFYFNNSEAKEMEFYSDIKEKPFDQKMGLNMVSETYPFPWIELPNDEELADPEKNICYYDWVRSYVLVDVDDSNKDANVDTSVKLYNEQVNLSEDLRELSASNNLEIPITYMANQDREIYLELRNDNNKVVAKGHFTAYAGYANLLHQLELKRKPKAGNYTLVASMKPVGGANNTNISTDKRIELKIQ